MRSEGRTMMVSTVVLFLVLVISNMSEKALGQSPYQTCVVYCQDNNISIDYPRDYSKTGPGGGWFVEFSPTSQSLYSTSIFVDRTPTITPLIDFFNSYV